MRTEIKVLPNPVSDTPATPSDRYKSCAIAGFRPVVGLILAAQVSWIENYIMFGTRRAGNGVATWDGSGRSEEF